MQIKRLLLAAAAVLLTALACQKEMSDFRIDNPGSTTTTTTVTASVNGRILDEAGAPVQGAVVKVGTSSSRTNINGEFTISSATLSEHAAFVTAEKTGYFTGSRTFIAKAGQKHYVEIQLLTKANNGTIDAATGGTVTLTTGNNSLTLPASAVVVKSTGAAYTGQVQVAMAWINPSAANMYRLMPGDLRGIDETNAEVGLQSFGMMAVELSSPAGEALQIAPGKKATLKFLIPASLTSAAPSSIPLWSFNDTTALWKQEGTATKSGNFYVAEVGHFSFWNCDAPFPIVQFSAKLVDQNGQPLSHVLVRIKRTTVVSYDGTGYTDTAGYVSGMVPKNELLQMLVYPTYSCGTAIYSQNIGPFSTATNLGTINITLSTSNAFTITGTVVNCSNTPVTNGYVHINTGTANYRTPVTNGAFSLSFVSCGGTQAITYYAFDSSNNVQSTPATATLTAGANNLGAISACGLSTQRYINFTIDGASYSILPPDSTMGYTFQNTAYISGYQGTSNTSFSTISLSFNGSAVGSFPLTSINVRSNTFTDSTSLPSGGINVNVTEFGVSGAYITGSFSGTLNGTNSTTHPIQCSFRVRRS